MKPLAVDGAGLGPESSNSNSNSSGSSSGLVKQEGKGSKADDSTPEKAGKEKKAGKAKGDKHKKKRDRTKAMTSSGFAAIIEAEAKTEAESREADRAAQKETTAALLGELKAGREAAERSNKDFLVLLQSVLAKK